MFTQIVLATFVAFLYLVLLFWAIGTDWAMGWRMYANPIFCWLLSLCTGLIHFETAHGWDLVSRMVDGAIIWGLVSITFLYIFRNRFIRRRFRVYVKKDSVGVSKAKLEEAVDYMFTEYKAGKKDKDGSIEIDHFRLTQILYGN